MELCDVASFAWENSVEIGFGKRAIWEKDTFTEKWFQRNYPDTWKKGGASGLYLEFLDFLNKHYKFYLRLVKFR